MSATCSFLGGFSGYGVETVLPFMGFKKMYLIRLKSRRKRKKKKRRCEEGEVSVRHLYAEAS